MKVLIITGLKEDTGRIAGLLKTAEVPVFSILNAEGDGADTPTPLTDDWFAVTAGRTDAVVYLSFVEAGHAERVLKLINEANKQYNGSFPLRGFIVPVELHT